MQIVHDLQGLHRGEFKVWLFFNELMVRIARKNAEQMLPFVLELALRSS